MYYSWCGTDRCSARDTNMDLPKDLIVLLKSYIKKTMKQQFTFRELTENDSELLPILLKKTWNHESNPAFWKWKFSYPGSHTTGWVVENESGDIVAFAGFWLRRTIIHGKTVFPTQVVDSMADPQYRGKVYQKILRKIVTNDDDMFFGFSNPTSHRIFKGIFKHRNALILEATVSVYACKFNPFVRFERHSSLHRLGSIAGRTFFRLLKKSRMKSGNISVEKVTVADKLFDVFFNRHAQEYSWIQDRSAAFINWRYVSCPTQQYTILRAMQNGEMAGYIIVNFRSVKNETKGVIIDWFVSRSCPEVFDALISSAFDWCLNQKTDSIEIWLFPHELSWISIIRKHYFIKLKRKSNMLFSYPTSFVEPHELKASDLFVTPGDSDYGILQIAVPVQKDSNG